MIPIRFILLLYRLSRKKHTPELTYTDIPALSGKKLISLLKDDGWEEKRRVTHGISMAKHIEGRTRVTVIPTKGSSLPKGTLMAILGDKQTGLGKQGLLDLLNKSK